jgi:hypothetical protein
MVAPEVASIALAMPKSASTAVPSALNRMLPGFTSRWTKPLPCAKSRPRATSQAMSSVSATLRPAWIRSRRVPPGMNSAAR